MKANLEGRSYSFWQSDFLLSVLSAAAGSPCTSLKTEGQLWEGEGIEEWVLDVFASYQQKYCENTVIHRELLRELKDTKNQKTGNFRSSERSCILCFRTALCRGLSSSAWICGRSSSPFLCILNVVGGRFSGFNQISYCPPQLSIQGLVCAQ